MFIPAHNLEIGQSIVYEGIVRKITQKSLQHGKDRKALVVLEFEAIVWQSERGLLNGETFVQVAKF